MKILICDIETAPLISYTWGMWEQNVIDIKNNWYILSYSYKWLGEKKTYTKALPDFKGYKAGSEDDKALMQDIHDRLDEADIVIAHNGQNFDIKKINARFSYHNMSPPSPYKVLDTKKEAKKYFAFDSNSLNNLGKFLKLGEKEETGGFKLWLGCMNGDKKSWATMKKYNEKDVILLEKVYLRLLPWMKTHPNVGNYLDSDDCCPKCGSDKLQKRGTAINASGVYQRFQCISCGGWCRDRENQTDIKPLISG